MVSVFSLNYSLQKQTTMEELEKLQTENKTLSDLIEKMQLDHKRTFDKYCQTESENKKLQSRNLELRIENIAELKASKILFKMVKGGYTHRQKNQIANNANIVLESDIQSKIQDLANSVSSDLPF
jgi:hypothetical protein